MNVSAVGCFEPKWAAFDMQAVWPDLAIYWTLGNFLMPLATINLPKSPTVLGNFCIGAKIFNFSSEIISGQLLWTFGDFLWSHCMQVAWSCINHWHRWQLHQWPQRKRLHTLNSRSIDGHWTTARSGQTESRNEHFNRRRREISILIFFEPIHTQLKRKFCYIHQLGSLLGPWQWLSGQRPCLLSDDPSSNPALTYSFVC